jgi:hypothetical protein
MKFTAASLIAAILAADSVTAFQPAAFGVRKTMSLASGVETGNSWKPDSEKMGSTDTGDYFPDDYEAGVGFTDGMMGSQANMNREHDGPQLPGMENLGDDAIMMGGIEMAEGIPEGMQFIPSSVPDGEIHMNVASSSSGQSMELLVKPVCMTYEDFFAAFSPDSSPIFSITPAIGRMDRRGGEPSPFMVTCDPNGKAGTFTADLVINLPEDNSKICYKFTASCN